MENNAPPYSLTTLLSGLAALASIIGIPVSSLLTYFLTRPKQSADIHKTSAEAGKIEAETRQIDSAIADRAYERLDQLEAIIHQMNLDKVKAVADFARLEWQLGLADQREKVLNQQITLAHAELETLRKPRVAG